MRHNSTRTSEGGGGASTFPGRDFRAAVVAETDSVSVEASRKRLAFQWLAHLHTIEVTKKLPRRTHLKGGNGPCVKGADGAVRLATFKDNAPPHHPLIDHQQARDTERRNAQPTRPSGRQAVRPIPGSLLTDISRHHVRSTPQSRPISGPVPMSACDPKRTFIRLSEKVSRD